MQNQTYLKRFMNYYQKNGILRTFCRLFTKPYQSLFKSKIVLIYATPGEVDDTVLILPPGINIECKKTYDEALQPEMKKVINHWEKENMMDIVIERFDKGAILWILKLDDDIAGFSWSITGKTIIPWYIPLTPHDAYVLDTAIFEEYRGRGLHPPLANYILGMLKKQGATRSVAEIGTWNKAALSIKEKSYYRKFSEVRKYRVFDRNITIWS